MKVITVARKPLEGTVAANALKYGTGGLNIDECRISTSDDLNGGAYSEGGRMALPGDNRTGAGAGMFAEGGGRLPGQYQQPTGRWPANVILQHRPDCQDSSECAEGCPVRHLDEQSGKRGAHGWAAGERGSRPGGFVNTGADSGTSRPCGPNHEDEGGASRFFKQVQKKAGGPTFA